MHTTQYSNPLPKGLIQLLRTERCLLDAVPARPFRVRLAVWIITGTHLREKPFASCLDGLQAASQRGQSQLVKCDQSRLGCTCLPRRVSHHSAARVRIIPCPLPDLHPATLSLIWGRSHLYGDPQRTWYAPLHRPLLVLRTVLSSEFWQFQTGSDPNPELSTPQTNSQQLTTHNLQRPPSPRPDGLPHRVLSISIDPLHGSAGNGVLSPQVPHGRAAKVGYG